MNPVDPRTIAPTRRTVLRSAAIGSAIWAAPVVVGVAAAPAAAASSPDPNPGGEQKPGDGLPPAPAAAVIVWENTTVDGNTTDQTLRGNFGVRCQWPAQSAVVTATVSVTSSNGQLAAPLQTFTGIATGSWPANGYSFPKLPAGDTYTVTFVATGILTQHVSQQTWQSETGEWALEPITAVQTWYLP